MHIAVDQEPIESNQHIFWKRNIMCHSCYIISDYFCACDRGSREKRLSDKRNGIIKLIVQKKKIDGSRQSAHENRKIITSICHPNKHVNSRGEKGKCG